jgi:hypothetical protein
MNNHDLHAQIASISFEEHNHESKAVWDSYYAGNPIRPPVVLGTATQYFIFNEYLNPGGAVTFETYSLDANMMLNFQLQAAAWRAQYIAPYCDDPVGLPESFVVYVDLQNFDEAAYFGAPVEFIPNQVPDTYPILVGDRKNALFDIGLPDPLKGGWYKHAHRLFDEMMEMLIEQPTYLDREIKMNPFGIRTSGPFTIAIALRGHELLTDLYEDPEYVHELLDFITEGTIARICAHLRFFDLDCPAPDMFFADDSIQLISPKMFHQFLLPVYHKLKSGVTTADRIKVHLCGDASHHFLALKEELGYYEFETGFPINFSQVRSELGPDVTIHGGPNVVLLRDGTPEEVQLETRRILESGILEGGRFILREGNNLTPHTPFENLDAMYQTARSYS